MKTVVALIVAILILPATLVHGQSNGIEVFTKDIQFEDYKPVLADGPITVRSKTYKISEAAINFFEHSEQGSIILNLFDDLSLHVDITSSSEAYGGGKIFTGSIYGANYSQVTIVYNQESITGNIAFEGQYYTIRPIAKDGVKLLHVSEIDQSNIEESAPPIAVEPSFSKKSMATMTAQQPLAESGDVIDVMVLYTTLVRQDAGSTANMLALINAAIADTNAGFTASQVNTSLNLVHAQEVNYVRGEEQALRALRRDAPDDTILNIAHTLRDEHNADLVVLAGTRDMLPSGCGQGYTFSQSTLDINDLETPEEFEAFAFSVVRLEACGSLTFAHELGHNFGNHHNKDAADPSPQGMYDYSNGYYNINANFRTIMSYQPTGETLPRINRWSNPNVNHNGVPTGIDPDVDSVNSAYAARTINETRAIVANFRVREYEVIATAGSGGSISSTSETVKHGEKATFTVTPDDGYVVDTVHGCGGSLSGNTYVTGIITSECSVYATFRIDNGEHNPVITGFDYECQSTGECRIFGTASDDDNNIVVVYVQVDGGDMIPAVGTTSWEVTTTLEAGPHRFQIGVEDSTLLWGYSEIVDFEVVTCQDYTENLEQHLANDRVWSELVCTSSFWGTCFAQRWDIYTKGSDILISHDGREVHTLHENSDNPGTWWPGECPLPVPPVINSVDKPVVSKIGETADTIKFKVLVTGTASDANNDLREVRIGAGMGSQACTGTTQFTCDLEYEILKSSLPFTGEYILVAFDEADNMSEAVTTDEVTFADAGACFTAKNADHGTAGRAYPCGFANLQGCAVGSNQNLGWGSYTTSLQEESPNYWVKVNSCP